MPIYGSEALRQYRQQQTEGKWGPEGQPSLLEKISPDVPMEDATITVWDGERFVDWGKWLATAPLIIEERPQEGSGKGTGSNESEAKDVPPPEQVTESLW